MAEGDFTADDALVGRPVFAAPLPNVESVTISLGIPVAIMDGLQQMSAAAVRQGRIHPSEQTPERMAIACIAAGVLQFMNSNRTELP